MIEQEGFWYVSLDHVLWTLDSISIYFLILNKLIFLVQLNKLILLVATYGDRKRRDVWMVDLPSRSGNNVGSQNQGML